MKNIVCWTFLCSFLNIGLSQSQTSLKEMRVSFEAEGIPASEAVAVIFSKHKIQNITTPELAGYRIGKVNCHEIPIVECLKKVLYKLPFDVSLNKKNDVIFIRKEVRKGLMNIFSENTNDTIVKPQQSFSAVRDTLSRASNINKIDEITLNAGYYAVKDKERTGSIAKVSSKDIGNQPVTNVLSSVQGRMAGVSISQNSGIPGGGFDVQIRGRNSLRTLANGDIDGNQPLYVIDGVPISAILSKNSNTIFAYGNMNPLNSINPNDIESIEVLKDADATAIYGSRGVNGVILITTKKGKSGRLTLTFNTNFALSSMVSQLRMMNTEQYLDMRRQAFANDGITTYPSNAYDLNGTWDQNRYTDWRKVLIGNTATSSNTQLLIGGGNAMTTFLVSLAHNEESTVFGRDFKYTGNNVSTSINHQSKDKRFTMDTYNMVSLRKNNVPTNDATQQAYLLSPNAPALYTEDGSINWQNNTFSNPVAAYNSSYSNDSKQFMSNLNMGYKINKEITAKVSAGLNYQNFDDMALEPNTMYNPSTAQGSSSLKSVATQTEQERFSLIIEPQITWNKKWKDHKLDFLLGSTFQNDVSKQEKIKGVGFESNAFINNIGAAKTKTVSDQVRSEYKYVAVFARLNYQFKDRYILNLTGRRDGSSRFGANKKFANFGAVGAAWIFSKEPFISDSRWLSFGKLRASFGTAGSDNIGDYQYLDTYTVSGTDYGGTTVLLPTRLYNPDYSWEKTTKTEAAVELGFLKNRINFAASWYRNRSSNQLVGYQLPDITGFSSVIANIGATVQNSGIELELNTKPFVKNDFKWETSVNISFPQNKLISFPGLEGSTYANQYVIGESTSIVKVYQLEGINPSTGQYVFTDFNGDGKISSPDDKQVVENLGIKFFGGISNTFQYKNWDLSVLFQFVKKNGRNYNYIMGVPGRMTNQPVEVLNVWSAENPNGIYMPYTSKTSTLHTLFTESNPTISDASFIRLKNIQLGFRIPLKESIFREVKIFFSGQNLFTWTKYFGIDPETLGIGSVPPLRTFSFGLQCNL